MTCPTRRALLSAVPFLALAACSTAQVDTVLAKIKDISQSLTDTLARYAGMLFPADVAELQAVNAQIQALTAGNWIGVAQIAARALVQIASKIVPLLPIPATVAQPLALILRFLAGFSGAVAPAGTHMALLAAAPTPSIDEAVNAARALSFAP